MAAPLTPDAVGMILGGNLDLKPVVQCTGVKLMQGSSAAATGAERYKLAISDGRYWCTAMMATQLNELAKTNQIHNNTIMRLDDYLSNAVQGKKIIIILSLTVIDPGQEHGPPIGTPVPYGDAQPQQQQPTPYSGAPQQPGPVKQDPYGQPAAGIYQNGSRPAAAPYGQPAASPYGAPVGGGYQNQAPSVSASPGSGYGRGGGGYQQQQQASAYGAPSAGSAYGAGRGGDQYGAPQGGRGAYGQPNPDYRAGNSAIARNEAPAKIVPINSLNAYQNRWTIKARVSVKGTVRTYHNARGEGKVFSFDLVDSAGGEIKVTAFTDACDKFYDLIQKGRVYMVSKASLKPKRAAFNNTRHDFEIQLENASVVQLCEDEPQDAIPRAVYHFKRIDDIESVPAGTMLDVLGVLHSIGDFTTITLKNGTEQSKRSIVLRDNSNRSIELTMWAEFASEPGDQLAQIVEQGGHPVVAVKSARVGDFNGKTLGTISTSLVDVDPDVPEAGILRNWFDREGGAQQVAQPLSDGRASGSGRNERRCTLAQITDEGMGTNGQPAFVQVSAWVNFIRGENLFYPACTGQYNGKQCNKKLSDQGNAWWCERCQAAGTPEWRYMLSLQVSDHTGQEWLTAFQEAGEEIMGMSASDLKALEDDAKAYDAALQHANLRPLTFNLKVAEDTYNDETRIKKSVNRVMETDWVKESKVMLDFIEKLKRGEPIMQATSSAPQQTGYGASAPASRAGTSYGQGGGGYTTPTPTRGYSGAGGGYGAGNTAGAYAAPVQANTYGAPNTYGGGGYKNNVQSTYGAASSNGGYAGAQGYSSTTNGNYGGPAGF
ncbi:hypothetical protein ABBQ32_012870 [Trebouxia sp. C0010 RCD-2024]